MPFGSVTLQPGVNVERTPTALRAGVSQSALIRYRDGLIQKFGGWQKFYPFPVSGTPRDLHAWQDLFDLGHLAVATTSQLAAISGGILRTITPQTLISNAAPQISTTVGSATVAITDPNISNVTFYDAIFFNVPVTIGGLLLDGLYQIASITGTHSYTITANKSATATETNPTATNGATAAGNATLHFAATPSWIAAGMLVYDITTPSAIPVGTQVLSVTGTTVVMDTAAAGAGVGLGDTISFVSLPIFTTVTGSSVVTVKLLGHGITMAGDVAVFEASTTGNGVTIQGSYSVLSVIDANQFTIQIAAAASAGSSFPMNSGNLQLVYYIAQGPSTPGTGYGLGAYGDGAYGYGTGSSSAQTGTPISATDWTQDNWGEILLSCPRNGGIYSWDPIGGFSNAAIIPTGPVFNSGIFVSTSEQVLIAYGSSVHQAIGYQQQPLLVQWSDVGNFLQWTATSATQAGNFSIPTGSAIMAGAAAPNQNLLWTDLDLWAMAYIGPPNVYGFNKIGAGMGAVSAHAMQILRGNAYWMGPTNFFAYAGGGAGVLPCPVWDVVFQNLNTAYQQNVRSMPNTGFNEVGWLYPSNASITGECDSYVKTNISEPGAPWDYGPLSRSAWIDQSPLGMPLAASPAGYVYQHETGTDADGVAMVSNFTTGYFYLVEGEDFVFVDQIIPDFKWGTFGGSPSARIQLTFNVVNYPDDTPRVYGPYTVTAATRYITVRFRGRMMSITVQSADAGSFWRTGSIKYRYNLSGRR